MEDNRKIVCNRCRRFVNISDIKYFPKGNDSTMAICSKCREQNTSEEIKKAPKAKQDVLEKKNYLCGRCRYKFKFDPLSVTNLRCPMCGKKDKITEDRESTAQEIIQRSEGF